MNRKFEAPDFANALAGRRYWVGRDSFSAGLSERLLAMAQDLFERGRFAPAKIGLGTGKIRKKDIRGDMTCWIGDGDGQVDWAQSPLPEFHAGMTELIQQARRELFLPIKRFESHFAFYPPGAFYKRHLDRHRGSRHRLLTCVFYIGPWSEGDGGELNLYLSSAETVRVEPEQGKFIVFDSEIPHEVEKTMRPRWSLTSWLRDDIL